MSHQLTIEPLGVTIEVEEGQTMLDAALRQGIYIPHACCHGLCGTCKVAVLDGEPEDQLAADVSARARVGIADAARAILDEAERALGSRPGATGPRAGDVPAARPAPGWTQEATR